MRPVIRQLLQQPAGFTPRQLFAALQGAWLEPTPGTIWQENTGVTPTTTGGQTLGLVLDQSQGAVLGPNIITNGDFESGTTGWRNFGSFNWAVTDGKAVHTPGVYGAVDQPYATLPLVTGRTYEVTFVITRAASSIYLYLGGNALTPSPIAASGTYIYRIRSTGAGSGAIILEANAAFDGSVDNISVREILGNHASQSVAANRPLLGRRYNLLTYSEDFSNAAWLLANVTTTTNKLTEAAGTAVHRVRQAITAGTYTLAVEAQQAERTQIWLGSADSATAVFDLSTGQVVSGSGTIAPSSMSGRYICSITAAFDSSGPRIGIYNGAVSYAGDITKGIFVYNADLRLTADVGKDPAYQRITTATDYDYGQYPAAVHDTTDSLVVSLPSINVRRNLLTYTEDFANAFWKVGDPANPIIPNVPAPDGSLSTKWVLNSTAVNRSFGSSGITISGGAANKTFTFSFDVYVPASNSANRFGAYIYASPEIPTVAQALNLNALPRNQWVRATFTWTFGATAGTDVIAQFHGNFLETVGDTIYVRRPQLELGSVATDYQKITDWTSEAYSSNGSVYFATPVGMSQLNNQSMGSTYTLPALSSDIYSWVVVPQRLSTVLENRLARYMERRAGIAGPDYFDQGGIGPEINTVPNNWFVQSIWVNNGDGSYTATASGSTTLAVYKPNLANRSTLYRITFTVSGYVAGTYSASARGQTAVAQSGNGVKVFEFTSGTNTDTAIYVVSVNGSFTGTISGVSIKEVYDNGKTGQLFADEETELLLSA